MGKFKQAHRAFLAGEKSNIPFKFQSEIQEKLGESSYALKETENARKYFMKAIEIEKRTKSTSRYRAESYIGLARIAMDAGNLAEAKKYLDEAHRAYPNHEEFVYAMTDWYILNNEHDKAKIYLHHEISQNSEAVFLQRDEIDYLEAKIAYAEQGDEKGASGVLEAISKAKGYNKALMARRFQSDPFFSKLQKNSDFQTKIAQVINEEESKNGAIPSIDNN
jgi:tetratricopeptide (TPR) repeat protein